MSFLKLICLTTICGALASAKSPPGEILFKKLKLKSEIRFCPDNTCDSVRGAADKKTLESLQLIYLYGISDYAVLDSWREEKPTKESVENMVSKFGAMCKQENLKGRSRCAFEANIKKYNLELFNVRFDEKEEIITPSAIDKARPNSSVD